MNWDTRMYWIHKYGVGRGYVTADHEKREYDDWKVGIITSVLDSSFHLSCMSVSRISSKHEEDLILLLIALISSSVWYICDAITQLNVGYWLMSDRTFSIYLKVKLIKFAYLFFFFVGQCIW